MPPLPRPHAEPDDCVQILRLGREGYTKIMENLMRVAAHLAEGLLATGTSLSYTAITADYIFVLCIGYWAK